MRYPGILRLGGDGIWRPLLGLPLLAIGVFGLQAVVVNLIGVVLVVTGTSVDAMTEQLTAEVVTPVTLIAVNLSWALAIPVVWLLVVVLHRLRPGWASSVVGRIRWGWLATCFAIAFATLLLTVVVSSQLPAQGDAGVELATQLNPWTDQVRDFLLVIVLLTPLQAAGEEYAFRGYLTQALGRCAAGWGRGRWGDRIAVTVAVVVPALLFALAHGLGQDLPIFFDRFAFGLVAGVLVVLTGGLEAGIAMHVLNNFLAFGLALAFGDMTEALTPTDGTWWSIPVTLTQSVVYLGGCVLVARWSGVRTRTDGGVLEPRTARV